MILDKFSLDGLVAVVTGGSRGLGKAVARALAEAGADVAVVSRTPNPSLEQEIRAMGRRYLHHPADLTKREQIRGVMPRMLEEMGRVDILVNNAGIIRRNPALQYTEEDWDATLEIHLTAAFILSQAAARDMIKRKRGKIINMASIWAFQGGMNVLAYAAAKHGLAGLTKAMANDWARHGINVNGIAPCFFVTEMTEAVRNDPERSKFILARTPAGRWGEPDDIAGAAVFLASRASDFIHGVILPVDGGWLAH
jgi:2-deoxy-D-gluconate 3-dehydrogenase